MVVVKTEAAKNGSPQRTLSARAARHLVDEINHGAANVRALLARLHSGQGWRALGYATWEECVGGEFVFGRQYAYRQLAAAQIEQRLSPIGDKLGHLILPESHARELAIVPENKQLEVYRRALETSVNGLTAAHLRQVIAKMGFRRRATIFDEASGPMTRRHLSDQAHATPVEFTCAVEGRFDLIDLDLAATKSNAVHDPFISPKQDSLKQDWTKLLDGGMGYLNPPFDPIESWIDKCCAEAANGARFVLLSRGQVDANWFWSMEEAAAGIYALTPRITFVGSKDAYPSPLVLTAFNVEPEPGGRIEHSDEGVGKLKRWHWKHDTR